MIYPCWKKKDNFALFPEHGNAKFNYSNKNVSHVQWFRDPRALNYLKNMTKHSSVTVWKGVVCELGPLGDKNAIDVITPVLKDEFHAVSISAAEALGYLGGIKSMDPLIEVLKDEHTNVRCTAAEAHAGIMSNDTTIIKIEKTNTFDLKFIKSFLDINMSDFLLSQCTQCTNSF